MKRNSHALRVWTPTGYREGNAFRNLWRVLSSPVFLIGAAVVDVVAMTYFNLTAVWWMWAIAPSTTLLAIGRIMLRQRAKRKLLVSDLQAKSCNRFLYAAPWLPNRYLSRIDRKSERTQDDHASSSLLYRHLSEAFITLGLYDETEYKKTQMLTGDEFMLIQPVEFYTDFILTDGIGYVLLMPSVSLIPKITVADVRIISRTLREIGLVNWTVEQVSYDDDLVLFLLKDETVSCAFDFSGE